MVIRWNPTEEMTRMENFMRHLFEGQRGSGEERAPLTRPTWSPAVDAWETEEGFHLVFDLPGVNKEDIQIEVEGEQLSIKGERKAGDDVKFLRRERVFGPFYRAFTLETPIEREKIKASFKSGVLEVVLPKKEEVKPKQISIEIAEE
jgi:HSP20 family protein